ncbi:MAG: MFS transporter [Patescibacteria group bacterium]|nr:MFS transporter [Patescibacteria group bacterium]
MLNFLEKKYFNKSLSKGFVRLYTGKTIVMIASAMLGIFLPIFLYNLFDKNFQLVMVYYGLAAFFYGITVSFGIKFLNKFGFRNALRASVVLGIIFYIIFYFIDQNNLKYLIPFSLLILVFYRLLYWLPYHVNFAKFTNKKTRGRQVSIIEATRSTLGVFIPLIAGIIVSYFSFDVLFIIAIILYLLSGIPYLTIPRTREKFVWTVKETWKQFFSKKRRNTVLAYIADGSENIIGVTVWPIFIYQLLDGNYFKVGAISTLIIAISVIAQLFLGKYIDSKAKKENILKWGSFLYSFGWLIKVFISTAFQIFVVGAYHSITCIFLRTPFDALTYEIAADQEHYVDEFTVLHEMALNFGRVLMIILIIIISFFFDIQWVFVLAALASMVFNLLEKKNSKIIKI